MTKAKKVSPDPLVMAVREALRDIEPRPLPTEMIVNNWGHRGWKCPLCGAYCHRHDRRGAFWYRHPDQSVDYSSYNMHFAHYHATPFWKEEHVIKVVRKFVMANADKITK